MQRCAQFLILDFLTHTEVKSFIKKSIDYILYVPVVKKCMLYDKVCMVDIKELLEFDCNFQLMRVFLRDKNNIGRQIDHRRVCMYNF